MRHVCNQNARLSSCPKPNRVIILKILDMFIYQVVVFFFQSYKPQDLVLFPLFIPHSPNPGFSSPPPTMIKHGYILFPIIQFTAYCYYPRLFESKVWRHMTILNRRRRSSACKCANNWLNSSLLTRHSLSCIGCAVIWRQDASTGTLVLGTWYLVATQCLLYHYTGLPSHPTCFSSSHPRSNASPTSTISDSKYIILKPPCRGLATRSILGCSTG